MFSLNLYNVVALASIILGLYSYLSFINDGEKFYKYLSILFLTNTCFLNFVNKEHCLFGFQLSMTLYLISLIIFSYNNHKYLPSKINLLYCMGIIEIVYIILVSKLSTDYIPYFYIVNFILCSILSYILNNNYSSSTQYKVKKLLQNEYEITLILNMCFFLSCFNFLDVIFPLYFLIIVLYCILLTQLYFYTNKNILIHERKKYDNLRKHFRRSVDLEYHRQADTLKGTIEEVKKATMKDPLTQSFNKKGIETIFKEWQEDENLKSFSIAMFDIDKFKTINDTLGHLEGDQCLKSVVSIIRTRFPSISVLGRFGGDEFILMIPHLSLEELVDIGEEIRYSIQMFSKPSCTISMGLAQYPENGNHLTELIEHADKGLYLSKQKGRNSISYYTDKFEKILKMKES